METVPLTRNGKYVNIENVSMQRMNENDLTTRN